MAIQIVNVEEILKNRAPRPLTLVSLHALDPVREPYRAILLQPEGVVEASHERVGFADRAFGHALCDGFLATAVSTKADLAIAPEYCVPWSTIDEVVQGNYRPEPGCIWALGCESIPPADLQTMAQRHNEGGERFFYCEPLDARQIEQKRYVDPLLYVFWANDDHGTAVLCLLVQVKTVACRDYRDVEQTSLCVGRAVYAFNRGLGKIGLLSIICSDAFDFTPYVDEFHLNCLLIHIQLNPKPAHADYAAYRMRLCSIGSNSHVELICLNWAQNIKELQAPGKYVDWKNVAGSAWYVSPAKFSADDAIIDDLHKHGLYYSLLKQRWHSFFLNYEGQILLLRKQKLMFPGEQAIVPKSCVSVIDRWTWSNAKGAWGAGAAANDGFSVALLNYTAIAGPLQLASQASPLAVERALEILVGPKGNPTSWFVVNELDAMHLDLDEESIRRVTVHQEVEPSRPGVLFRKQRLQRAQDAVSLPGNNVPWPVPLRDLEQGFRLGWTHSNPHHNVVPVAGNRGSATLVYLADEADAAAIERVHQKLRQGLVNHATAASKGKSAQDLTDDIVRCQDRLCIVFRRGIAFGACGPEGLNVFDRPADESPVDIAGDRP